MDDESQSQEELVAQGGVDATETVEESEKLRDDLVQLAADFENFRRDAFAAQNTAERRGVDRAVRALAPVYDALLFAIRVTNHEGENSNIAAGVKKIADQFSQALLTLGIFRISTDGGYDPKFHEAVEKVPGERFAVIEEVGSGWMWQEDGRVIVPAKVKVGAG